MPAFNFSRLKWTRRLLILSPFLLIISIWLMGGGHGWFEPAMFLFPFAMLIWSLKISMAWAFVLAGIMQYTAYGLLVDYFKEKKKERLAIVLLLVAHLIVAFLLLLYFKNHISQ